MSTSLNSVQLQGHLGGGAASGGGGGNGGGGVSSGPTSLSIHSVSSATVHVPSGMSTSLHSGSGSGSLIGATFDANGTAWNSTSSLSPTISSHQRKCEVKLNAMP